MAVKAIKKNKVEYDVAVIGGGPAGLMAAGIAAKNGAKVILLEKNEELGKKLLLTGGGRCNITNAEPDHRNFVSKYGKKGNFLFTPFSVFGVEDSVKFFNDLGIKTKIEPGFRVFPESDKASDVLEALVRYAKNNGVEFKLSTEVIGFEGDKSGGLSLRRSEATGKGESSGLIKSVVLKDKTKILAKNFILVTGGKSHPETGSTGEGFDWLKKIGHKVNEPNPALVPVKIKEPWIGDFAGITLEDVGVSIWQADKKVLNKKGRVLFTHTGLSGPMILNMSKDIGDLLQYSSTNDVQAGSDVKVSIDFFPGLGLDVMHDKFLKLFEEHSNKKIKNLILPEVPTKILLKILGLLHIDGEIEMHSIFREERTTLIEKLKKFDLRIEGLAGFDEAIVSSGGLDLSEIDFKQMKSKLFNNLFFAGDILDFDRSSGGYSLQLCWTTGYIAGKSASEL